MYRLFIVEDDPGIANAVAAQAQAWNLQTHIVQDFSNVMHEFAEFSPHIVLLDIMLPFFDGYHWCSEIRRVSKVPIIFVSSAPYLRFRRQCSGARASRRTARYGRKFSRFRR